MPEFIGGSRCGVSYWNAWNVTVPFARLTIAPDELVLSTFLSMTRRFTKSQITKISVYGGVFPSPGIRIEHTVHEYGPFTVFWTFRPAAVKSALIENGYIID